MTLDQLAFETSTPSRSARPFLKWAGGKSSLLSTLTKFVPDDFNNYFEPFLGGGAFFFALRPKSAILSDANSEPINCYEIVKENPAGLIASLSQYRVSSEEFYRIQALNIHALSTLERATCISRN
jgi:DNA adenine methylase